MENSKSVPTPDPDAANGSDRDSSVLNNRQPLADGDRSGSSAKDSADPSMPPAAVGKSVRSAADSELHRSANPLSCRLPIFRNVWRRIPPRCRPALYFDTLYNVGAGAFISLFLLSTVVLKTVLPGTENHLALVAAAFGGSSLLSPLASYLGRWIPMRSMVVFPNFLVVVFLLATTARNAPAWFTACIGLAFVIRVFPRVAEMNMYRILYPPARRGTVVGWLKAVAAVSGLSVTALGYWWFTVWPSCYWVLYCFVALLLAGSAFSYRRIPISRRNVFARSETIAPHRALREGMRIFFNDRRFLLYQFGFAIAGTANHMALVFIPEILKERVRADATMIGLVGALLPVTLMMTSAPLWGRYLDRVNPMTGRATFNTIQCSAFAFDAYGGLTLQVWPFVIGAILHGIGNGGGTINWLTGSLYFAHSDRISLYNAIHVCLTGIRGLIAPAIGLLLISPSGLNLGAHLFTVAAGLSLMGAVIMGLQGRTDPGPRELDTLTPPDASSSFDSTI